jgi:hypothetical protein
MTLARVLGKSGGGEGEGRERDSKNLDGRAVRHVRSPRFPE